MSQVLWYKIIIGLLLIALTSCGGSSSNTSSTSNSDPDNQILVTGTIDGFGSIFVNGIKFETESADIILDDVAGNDDDLRLGMIVTVSATQGDDISVATAISIEFDDDVQGPVSNISTSPDGNNKSLIILGVSVFVDRISTVIDDTTFESIAINDVFEVSGFYDASNTLIATRIEKKQVFVSGVSEVELKGFISNLSTSSSEFILGNYTVNYVNADLFEVPNAILTEGMQVEVKGTLSNNTIDATRVEEEDDLLGGIDGTEDFDKISIEGFITDFTDNSNFRVAGIEINAANAILQPVNLVLKNDVKVEAEGALTNGVLIATSVEARGGDIELDGNISVVDGNIITIDYIVGSATFLIDVQSQLRDDTDTFLTLTADKLQTGDFIEVKARLNGGDIFATELRLDEQDDNIIQAAVDSFTTNTEVTVLGISFNTEQAQFEDANDQPITAADFYQQLSIGKLVKIKDEEPADGVAEEVEFEQE